MHLIEIIKNWYDVKVDQTISHYIEISFDQDYKDRTYHILIPNYIKNKLKQFNFESNKKQHLPYQDPKKILILKSQYQLINQKE